MFLSFLSCKEALAYLDRELSPREQTLVARHLKICRHCTQMFRFESTFHEQLQQKLRRVELPLDLQERLFASLPLEPNAQK